MNRLPRPALALAMIAAAGAGALWLWSSGHAAPRDKYRSQAVDRGDIVQAISANGTLNPVILVNVGTQVSGTVQRLHADFNQQVQAGQVLAELDPALIEAQIRQHEAGLASAQASLKLARTKENRTRELVQKGFLAQTQLDDAVQATEAAEAQVASVRAQLERERTNLRYAVIRSPISGVVVARNVDVGQTVAASFQTPTLFQIAQDLRNMQIDTSVAEADIGLLRTGQTVKFSVDAFPDRDFAGTVRQIRLNPTVQQNVVTYNVVVAVENERGELLPGMTAHVRFSVAQKPAVLRVPNAALRYRPAGAESDKGRRAGKPTVYKLENGAPVAVPVKTGIADMNFTEIVSGEIKEGDKVIVREAGERSAPGGSFRFRMF